VKLNGFLQYIKFQNFEGFLEWFECKFSNVVTKLLQWCDVVYLQKGQGALDHKGDGLVGENFTMGQIFK
jgi:hypothetical protein